MNKSLDIVGSFSSFNILRLSGVIAVFLIIFISIIYYNKSIKKIKTNETLSGYALLIFILINYFKNITRDILGKDLEKTAPVFLTLFSYIALSNVIGIIGVENPTSSIWVTLTFGMFSFIGTFVIGFRYQRFSFLYKFTFNIKVKIKSKDKKIRIPVMINPLEVISSITPLISLSFRLWGNIFAGALILLLIYNLPSAFANGVDSLLPVGVPIAEPLILLSSLITPPVHLFLDIGIGLTQALVFILLTMVYWTLNKE